MIVLYALGMSDIVEQVNITGKLLFHAVRVEHHVF